MRNEFHSAFHFGFQGTVIAAMSLHGPLPVFFLPVLIFGLRSTATLPPWNQFASKNFGQKRTEANGG